MKLIFGHYPSERLCVQKYCSADFELVVRFETLKTFLFILVFFF